MWMLTALVSTALAYPLNYPDARRMGGFRCVEHPVMNVNNADLADAVVSESPPGPPVFAPDLQRSLGPFASDEAMKATAKGKRVESFPAVASLALRGQPAKLVCEPDKPDSVDEYRWGCGERPLGCTAYIPLKSGSKAVRSTLQVGTLLGKITDPNEALGLVALIDAGVFLPMSPGELQAWAETAQGYRGIQTDKPWVEVVEHDYGWIVRAPRVATCGCERDVVRRAFWVSDDGRVCQVQEQPVALAHAVDPCPAK